MHSLTVNHWSVVKHLLKYLQHTKTWSFIIFVSPYLHLQAFTNADYAGSIADRKSTGGFAIFLGDNLISWTSKKQWTVVCSSTESKSKALADEATELTWIQSLLFELGIHPPNAPTLWYDNIVATYLCHNPIFHVRKKHAEIDYHFVRDKVARKNLHVCFISTKDQPTDVLTKPLPSARFQFL